MNSIITANVFENPLALAVIVLLTALSNWLIKRRQAGALASPNENELPPSPSQQERSARQPDLPGILRRLLAGESPPPVTLPPIPYASRDQQALPAEGGEKQVYSRQRPPNESGASYEGLPRRMNQTAEPLQQHGAVSSAIAGFVKAGHPPDNGVCRVAPLNRIAIQPVTAMDVAPGRHSRVSGHPIRLWRDRQIVRRAFVASLIFAPPKGLEA